MDHSADIRLVNAHAERNRGDDHRQFAGPKPVLGPLALLRRHPGVIGGGRIIRVQYQRQQLGFLAGRGVDDGGPPRRLGQNPPHRFVPVGNPRFHRLHRQIGAAETVDGTAGIRQIELLNNIVLHQHGRGCGQRDHRRGPQQRQIAAQHPVIGAEIVAPLGNAVRLVHRDQHGLASGQHFGEARHAQPLRGDEQIIQVPVQILDADLARGQPVAA